MLRNHRQNCERKQGLIRDGLALAQTGVVPGVRHGRDCSGGPGPAAHRMSQRPIGRGPCADGPGLDLTQPAAHCSLVHHRPLRPHQTHSTHFSGLARAAHT